MILPLALAWSAIAQTVVERKEQLQQAIVDAGWRVHGMSHNLCDVRGRELEERRLWAQVIAADDRYRARFGEDSGAGIITETLHYTCGRRDRWRDAHRAARAALLKIQQLEGR